MVVMSDIIYHTTYEFISFQLSLVSFCLNVLSVCVFCFFFRHIFPLFIFIFGVVRSYCGVVWLGKSSLSWDEEDESGKGEICSLAQFNDCYDQ